MAIPDYQTCMLPFLRFLEDGMEHTLRDAEDSLAAQFSLTPAERAALLPSGRQGIFKNRIGWARTYLKKAGLLESPKRNQTEWAIWGDFLQQPFGTRFAYPT